MPIQAKYTKEGNNMKTIIADLNPVGLNQKSFYGRAKIICDENGFHLKSYDTIVCSVSNDNKFLRHWDDWSATTAKHVNSFRCALGHDKINKSAWLDMAVTPL